MFNNLKAEMKRYGVSQKDLAEIIGVFPSAISLKLNGKSPISLEEAGTIKKFFNEKFNSNFTLDYLFE